jgi:AcrR family transcriptional regulator
MMNNDRADVQEVAEAWDAEGWADPRVERSTRAVLMAMGQLLPEVPYGDLTVQQILERAGISRGTFYKHYRNKDAALRASLGAMLSSLQRAPGAGNRLFPVRELIEHAASATALGASLEAADRLEQLWDDLRSEVALRLEAQLAPVPGSFPGAPVLASRVLAGAMVELVRYAGESRAPVSATTLDERFHRMAMVAIGQFGCARRDRGHSEG